MRFIDASRLAEFLDDRRNEPLNVKSIRTDLALLKKAGVTVRKDGRKHRRKIRVLEYFLLRTHLYRRNGPSLLPHHITLNWSDYAKTWHHKLDGKKIHVPFLGKVAFLCKKNGSRRIVCHPDSVAEIEKICIDPGKLTFQKDPDKVNLMYKAKTCRQILERYKQKKMTEEFLEYVSNTPFGRALASINLAFRENKQLRLTDNGLLLAEMKKIPHEDDLEKVARLILRKEQQSKAQISSVIVSLEYLERQGHPSENPVGMGNRYRVSDRTKKRYERLDYYQIVEEICSIDARVASNVLSVEGDRSPGFAAFGAFIDTYHRIQPEVLKGFVHNFSFLSWYTDPIGYLARFNEDFGAKLKWPAFKVRKTMRHRDFLLRSIKEDILYDLDRGKLSFLQSKCKNSEFINMNIDRAKMGNLEGYSDQAYCPSNIFMISKVPVNRGLFESSVLDTLQSPSKFKDSQGAFYYPDFRFLIASTLGLSLKSVDQFLAYLISKGSDLGGRLWFFPAFGRVPRRDAPDQELVNVVRTPFDSIALNY